MDKETKEALHLIMDTQRAIIDGLIGIGLKTGVGHPVLKLQDVRQDLITRMTKYTK